MRHLKKVCIFFIMVFFIYSSLEMKSIYKSDSLAKRTHSSPNYKPGEILVKLKKGISFNDLQSKKSFRELDVKKQFSTLSKLKGQQYLLLKINKLKETTEADIINTLASEPEIDAVSLNYKRELARIPNDPLFPQQWALHNTGQVSFIQKGTPDADIDAPEAWNTNTGSPEVVIAILDTGVDYNHEDLKANMWKNPGETAGNNFDDDGNGYIDDIYGYDFAKDNAGNNGSDPMDEDVDGHGTHISGIIGARGNNGIGISGICWNVKIMAVKIQRPDEYIYTSDEIEGIEYVVQMKTQFNINVVAINCSFGGTQSNSMEQDIIEQAHQAGIAVCAAAGNGGDDWVGDDNSQSPYYPASYNVPNIISVAATDENDQLTEFSNFGRTTVDIAAPGINVKSLAITGKGYDASVIASGNYFFALGMEFAAFTSGITKSAYNCNMGINSSDFPAGVNGNIAIIERGEILFSQKVQNAQNAGAIAVIIYNNESGNFMGTLGAQNNWVPAITLSRESGLQLVQMGNPTITLKNGRSNYNFMDGTSMSTPHVTGAIALMASKFPNENLNKRIMRVLLGGDLLPSLQDKLKSGARLNIASFRLQAPLNLMGERIKNQSFLQTEYIDFLTWQSNPQNGNKGVVKYLIYQITGRNFSVIGEVSSTTFEFRVRQTEKLSNNTYAVMAVNGENARGEPSLVTINN